MKHQLLFVCFVLCASIIATQNPIPCVAIELIDDNIDEEWDFEIPHWEHSNVSVVSSEYNMKPWMDGIFTYFYSFCRSLNIYIGNYTQDKNAYGWSFGVLTSFIAYDVMPDRPPSGPASFNVRDDHHDYTAYLQFTQVFDFGDSGPPCTLQIPRKATVNIYCGLLKANCTQVPGNKGPSCLDYPASTDPGFCLCSLVYNTSLCTGLTLNLLSNYCPYGYAVPIIPPVAPRTDASFAVSITFATLAILCFVVLLGGYIYNCTVHSKRGCQAIPFYDTCTGHKDVPQYTSPSPSHPGYGSLAQQVPT